MKKHDKKNENAKKKPPAHEVILNQLKKLTDEFIEMATTDTFKKINYSYSEGIWLHFDNKVTTLLNVLVAMHIPAKNIENLKLQLKRTLTMDYPFSTRNSYRVAINFQLAAIGE